MDTEFVWFFICYGAFIVFPFMIQSSMPRSTPRRQSLGASAAISSGDPTKPYYPQPLKDRHPEVLTIAHLQREQ
jgi:hypothetical protein